MTGRDKKKAEQEVRDNAANSSPTRAPREHDQLLLNELRSIRLGLEVLRPPEALKTLEIPRSKFLDGLELRAGGKVTSPFQLACGSVIGEPWWYLWFFHLTKAFSMSQFRSEHGVPGPSLLAFQQSLLSYVTSPTTLPTEWTQSAVNEILQVIVQMAQLWAWFPAEKRKTLDTREEYVEELLTAMLPAVKDVRERLDHLTWDFIKKDHGKKEAAAFLKHTRLREEDMPHRYRAAVKTIVKLSSGGGRGGEGGGKRKGGDRHGATDGEAFAPYPDGARGRGRGRGGKGRGGRG